MNKSNLNDVQETMESDYHTGLSSAGDGDYADNCGRHWSDAGGWSCWPAVELVNVVVVDDVVVASGA